MGGVWSFATVQGRGWFRRSGLSHFLQEVKRIMKTSQRGGVIVPAPVCLHLLCQISWFWHHGAGFTPLDNISFHLHKIMKAGNGEDKTIYLLTWKEVICEHGLVQDQVWTKGNAKKQTERWKVRGAGRMVNWNMTVGGGALAADTAILLWSKAMTMAAKTAKRPAEVIETS